MAAGILNGGSSPDEKITENEIVRDLLFVF
jgi:hypothetical protein